MTTEIPSWLLDHRAGRPYYQEAFDEGNEDNWEQGVVYPRDRVGSPRGEGELVGVKIDSAFNRHSKNDGTHVSPFDNGAVHIGTRNIEVNLLQGIDEKSLRRVLSRTLRATTGISPDEPVSEAEWEEMMRGGLQSALETQTIVFEVFGASRVVTHQLVRSRKAGFHQQSQRATWFGDRPDARWPHSIGRSVWEDFDKELHNEGRSKVRRLWEEAQLASWKAYSAACDAGISYQDARYILPEGTTNYIVCEYTLREFINVYSYRACEMFLWEMWAIVQEMGRIIRRAHPMLADYIKISCEKTGSVCSNCDGRGTKMVQIPRSEHPRGIADPEWLTLGGPGDLISMAEACSYCQGTGRVGQKCTFQGWENVEGQCSKPWAKQSNRTFLPNPKFRIGG